MAIGRHRRCNHCDCRDDNCAGEIPQVTPVCCTECPEGKSPCEYVAHFGCTITDDSGACLARSHELLKPKCDFAPVCEWWGLGHDYDCDSDVVASVNAPLGYEWRYWGCTWDECQYAVYDALLFGFDADGNETENVFGWGWVLKLEDGGARFISAAAGEYSTESWVCDGKNELTKQAGSDARLPERVCITPFWARRATYLDTSDDPAPGHSTFEAIRDTAWRCPCPDECTGTEVWESVLDDSGTAVWVTRPGTSTCSEGCASYSPQLFTGILPDVTLYGPSTDGYEVPCHCQDEDSGYGWKQWKLGECDPLLPCGYTDPAKRCSCCDPCCECMPGQLLVCGQEVEVQFCTGGRTGIASPAGVSREACHTFTVDGTDYEVCAVAYCDGVDWKVDGYVDDVLVETVTATFTCCPLRFDFEIEWGIECEPVETCCCPDDPWPATIYMTLDGCLSTTITLTHGGTKTSAVPPGQVDWWGGTGTSNGHPVSVSVWCVDGAPCISWWHIVFDDECSSIPSNFFTSVTCSPLELSANYDFSNDCGCTAYSLGISVTA